MKKMAMGALLVVLVSASACQTSSSGTGDLPPVVIDLSQKPSPTPTSGMAFASAPTAAMPVPTSTPTPAPASAEAQVVAAQVDAFNRHDLEAFMSSYAADAVLYDYPDHVRQSGAAEIRQAYAAAFAGNPALHVNVSSRITQGRLVIQQETLTGTADGQVRASVVTYEVVNGKIVRVGFAK